MSRTLIDPNPLVLSLLKDSSFLLHLAAHDDRFDLLWCGDELWWSSGESRELVLDGQLVSRDTDPSCDLTEVNEEVNTQTENKPLTTKTTENNQKNQKQHNLTQPRTTYPQPIHNLLHNLFKQPTTLIDINYRKQVKTTLTTKTNLQQF